MDSARPSGTSMLAPDPLSPICCDVEHPWIRLVCPAHPTDAKLDEDQGNLDAKTTPDTCCCDPQTVHYPAEGGHSHRGIPLLSK